MKIEITDEIIKLATKVYKGTGCLDVDYNLAITLEAVFEHLNKGEEISKEISKEIKEIEKKQPDSDGWIERDGGKCPVDGDTEIEIKLRNGQILFRDAQNCYWDYPQGCANGNIIAYRIIKQQPEYCNCEHPEYVLVTSELRGGASRVQCMLCQKSPDYKKKPEKKQTLLEYAFKRAESDDMPIKSYTNLGIFELISEYLKTL